jgi:hypothetical protein
MIQLSLFPVRGFGLLLDFYPRELAVDSTERPVVFETRRRARYARDRKLPSWLRAHAAIVPVEVHPPVDNANGLPTFLIGS